ncbi:phosphonopyruvate decarboxylase [Limibacillus halophilus]|uniref:Sulfopyruvate decarboxylase alpha subunit n=1 Tax=Limibacillus halophilus TaxID=1579333 RepID=A0A839SWR9_9PROT|nr:phosphonopyruvate decarboxylase [Limibacillus halophilus]MBB3065393.1 sulfopyruvate decarboxylase alpha subunit [Limibacillus halophilus]
MSDADRGINWPQEIYASFKAWDIRQVGYVPDAGHKQLIAACLDDPEITTSVLTTEEEGVGLLAGADLGGQRGALLMQSSGVGNCINTFSLLSLCGFPFLALVTMRGEWGEVNAWQMPMGQATPKVLGEMGFLVLRADQATEVAETLQSALALVFEGKQRVAVLLGQRLLGAKRF